MEIINCTPHNVNIVKKGKIFRSFEKGQEVPRLSQKTKIVSELKGIPLTETSFGQCENLPEQKDSTYLIVSRMIKSAYPDRKDLLVPNGVVRDEQGNIIGCESLAIN